MKERLDKLVIDDTTYITKLTKKFMDRKPYEPVNSKILTAFIPGTIRKIYVKTGDTVNKGDNLLVLEAMKMKNIIKSDIEGKIKSILVNTNETVAKNQILIEFE